MKYKFVDLVDIAEMQNFIEKLYLLTGIPLVIKDMNGNHVVAVGFREICKKFHKANRNDHFLCEECTQYVKNHIDMDKPYIYYKCQNGLVDAAAPIVIGGRQLATLYYTQFLFEKPNKEEFLERAKKYGFDEEEYLKALEEVPVCSKNKLDLIMNFLLELVTTFAEKEINKIKLLDLKEKRFQVIAENTPKLAIQSYDNEGNLLYMNKASEEIYGFKKEEAINKNIKLIIKRPEKAKNLLKIIKNIKEPVGPWEWIYESNNGIEKRLYSTIFPIALGHGKKEIISLDIDITEEKRIEKELLRFDKLNMVGEMAASIAHEVRNPLTTVRGFLQLLGHKEECHKYIDNFDLMIEELDRANSIVTEFLSFTKNKVVKLEMKNLNLIINRLAPLMEANAVVYGQDIKLELENIPDLKLDEKEIRQLILNLVRNGIESMEKGSTLTIRTYTNDDQVVLQIKDVGKGIPKEILGKLGTPFFTTKEKGTGLGLAVCYKIAERHNAKVDVESNSCGTSFFIKFKIR